MKISTVDDQQEPVIMDGSRISGYNLSRSQNHKKSRTPHLIYLAIIAFLIAIVLFNLIRSSPDSGDREVLIKLKELENKFDVMQKEETTHVELITNLKKDFEKREENMKGNGGGQGQGQQKRNEQNNQNSQNNQSQPAAIPATPAAPAAPATPAPPPPPKEIKSTNKAKNLYMTAQLQKISDFRRQKGGMGETAAGSVSLLNYLTKNKDGKTIEEVLYDADQRQPRRKFHEQRVSFTTNKKNFPGLYLTSFNNRIDSSRDEEQSRVEAEEFARLDRIWNFQQFKEELPMCVVVPGYNNNAKFRIEYNLNSIFQQNYTNYFVVVINDASTDNSDELYRKYFDFYQISKDSYAYVENKERKTALENIYIATHDYCSPDSIVLNLDADDEFIGKNVLKTFNAGYQKNKAGVVYSNFFWYDQGGNIMLGFTSEYTETDKKNKTYRQAPQRFSHLRSYRTELFLKIKKEDFQDKDGKFWTSAYDMVMYFPLMELSCGRVNKIDGFHYLYNINTGLNDYAVDRGKQSRIDQTVRRGSKYDCSIQFDEKMKSLP